MDLMYPFFFLSYSTYVITMLLSDQYNYIASAARLTQCEALNAPSRDFDLQNMHVFEVALCLDPDIGKSD